MLRAAGSELPFFVGHITPFVGHITPHAVPWKGKYVSQMTFANAGRAISTFNMPRIKLTDVGLVPLMASMTFIYFPAVVKSYTQPWVFLSALIALFTFRTEVFLFKKDLPLIFLSLLCVVAYVLRSNLDQYELLRQIYLQATFVALWIVARRENGDYFGTALRVTIVVWFLFGLYEFISSGLGYGLGVPSAFAGNYVPGRSGIPGLGAEPSFYGSLSMVQLMYLLAERDNKKNGIYIACAAASVILSGSLLSAALLIFPLMKLPTRARIIGITSLPVVVFLASIFSSAGIGARLANFDPRGSILSILVDQSINLRVGHAYFTLYHNFFQSILTFSPVQFMIDYNKFADQSGVFVDTDTNIILTTAGELIYNSGIVGLLLLFVFIYRAQSFSGTRARKVEKITFILACLLNPISLANIFLIVYATQKEKTDDNCRQ